MAEPIKIAVDAMGGDNSPKKIIQGISHHSKNSENIDYKIFGDENQIKLLVDKQLYFFEIFFLSLGSTS